MKKLTVKRIQSRWAQCYWLMFKRRKAQGKALVKRYHRVSYDVSTEAFMSSLR